MTAVPVEMHGGAFHLAAAIMVNRPSIDQDTEADSADTIIDQLKKAVNRSGHLGGPVALSLGGGLYQSELHHSEFTEAGQFKQTLRFDIEEDFMLDAETVGLCFHRKPTKGDGTDLFVHTADRRKLQGLFDSLEIVDLDGLIALPDIVSWYYYLREQKLLDAGRTVLAVGWAVSTLYILVFDRNHQVILARGVSSPTVEDARTLLGAELKRSIASLPQEHYPERILYHHHDGGLSGAQVEAICREVGIESRQIEQPSLAAAFAAGSAIAWLNGDVVADFREDSMPPRSVVTARHRSLFGFSVSLTVLLLAIIVVLYAWSARYDAIIADADRQMIGAWQSVYPDQDISNVARIPRDIKRMLDSMKTKSRSRDLSSDASSAANTLMLVLDMLDKLPEKFDIVVDSLRTSPKVATLQGSVPDLEDMETLHKAINGSPYLKIENWDTQQSVGRDKNDPTSRRTFNMSLKVVSAADSRENR